MRKKTIDFLFDNIFWYVLYALPLLLYLVYSFNNVPIDISQFFTTIGFNLTTNNIIFDTLNSIFGVNGVLPLISDTNILLIFGWFITIHLFHLLVDFILFFPRLCHKYFEKGVRE